MKQVNIVHVELTISRSNNLIFWLCNYVLVNSDMQLTNIMQFSNVQFNVNGVYLHVTIYKT
jgi:hypothetical protein